ncbi:hypothetical protein E3E22_03025 [Thermococcus sp. MV5]|uniref:hypothetical protein n=1 Tax=Thermococcus sp. MV5 TaxID=1638272 RepID=UPI00143ADE18|nr:hypothetical protein [Thermococcus sp. MV5]NJE25608.1 hypothetical protein [Thermococcus sp. MV5]
MTKQKTKNTGSPLWFWIGAFTLALITFIFTDSVISFIERYNTISEWPILGMLVVEIPLILFGIYCVKKGKGNMYSLKADLLPMLIISLLSGLGRLFPPNSAAYYWVWSAVPVLAFVGLPIYYLHRRALRKMGMVNIPRSERNRKIIELQCSYDDAFNLCISALNLIKGAKILDMDKSSGFIVAKTGKTMKSWGEIITFNIHEVNDKVRIEVISKPQIRPQLFVLDYGKNYENVKKIVDFLKNKAS